MANFPTHAGTGAFVGFAYGAAAHWAWDMPLPTAVLAGGLCAVASLLPDVDSDHGVILREVLAFVAAIIPMFLLDRFRSMQLPQETIIAVAGLIYVIIRFGGGEIVRRMTVHRGMWHSIPAAAVVSLIVYFLCDCPDINSRMVKTFAATTGYIWHLLLDEIWSVERMGGRVRVKRSFGTALKFFGSRPSGNVLVYGALVGMLAVLVQNPRPGGLWDAQHHHHGHQESIEVSPEQPPYRYPQRQMTPLPSRETHPDFETLARPEFGHGSPQPVYQPPR